MNVLYVLGKEPTGGVGSVVKNFQFHFSKSVKLDYLIFHEVKYTPFNQEVKNYGARVYIMPDLTYKNIGIIIRRLNQFMKVHKKEYDLIHVHSPILGGLIFYCAKRYHMKNFILHSHSNQYSECKGRITRNKILFRLAERQADYCFACSDAAKKLYHKRQVEIIHNGIDVRKYEFNQEKRSYYRKQLGIENETIVGFVGRFSAAKNLKFILNLAKKLTYNKQIKFVLIGDGELFTNVEEKIKDFGLEDCVLLLGNCNKIEEYLNLFDLFIMPSFFEGLPMAAIEAQCNGLKCLLSDRITKTVKVLNSLSFLPINDPRVWIEQIKKTMVSYDRSIEEAWFKKFDIEVAASDLEEKYKKICQRSNPAHHKVI